MAYYDGATAEAQFAAEWNGEGTRLADAPVVTALSMAREQAEKLAALVHMLRDRLSPVLQPEIPMKQDEADPRLRGVAPVSQLRSQIEALSSVLMDTQDVVRSVTERLDV